VARASVLVFASLFLFSVTQLIYNRQRVPTWSAQDQLLQLQRSSGSRRRVTCMPSTLRVTGRSASCLPCLVSNGCLLRFSPSPLLRGIGHGNRLRNSASLAPCVLLPLLSSGSWAPPAPCTSMPGYGAGSRVRAEAQLAPSPSFPTPSYRCYRAEIERKQKKNKTQHALLSCPAHTKANRFSDTSLSLKKGEKKKG